MDAAKKANQVKKGDTQKTCDVTKKATLMAKMSYEEVLTADTPQTIRVLAESIIKEGYLEAAIKKMTTEDAKNAVAKMDALRPFAMRRIISKVECELCNEVKNLERKI